MFTCLFIIFVQGAVLEGISPPCRTQDSVFLLIGLALWMVADSDDDDRSGGLRQPVLVPVPVRSQYRR